MYHRQGTQFASFKPNGSDKLLLTRFLLSVALLLMSLIGFKTGFVLSEDGTLVPKHVRDSLYYVCIIIIVHLVGTVKYVHGPKKCTEWKALKFVMSVWSVRPHGTTWRLLDGFS